MSSGDRGASSSWSAPSPASAGSSHGSHASGGRTRGIRSWMVSTGGRAGCVRIAHDSITSPSRETQRSHSQARAKGAPSLRRTKNGSLAFLPWRFHSKNPLTAIRHLRARTASRNTGEVAALSTRASARRPAALRSFVHEGMRPQTSASRRRRFGSRRSPRGPTGAPSARTTARGARAARCSGRSPGFDQAPPKPHRRRAPRRDRTPLGGLPGWR